MSRSRVKTPCLLPLSRVLLLGALSLLALPLGAEIKEQIVAIINDDIVTYSELDRMLVPMFEQYERIYSGAELFSMLQKARHDVLENLIEQKLILQEAKKQNIREQMGEEFSRELEKSIADVKSKFPSEKVFASMLERDGMTLADFREKQEELTLIRGMILKEVYSRCVVSPGEAREYYDAHKDEFTEKEKLHVSQIWIKGEEGNEGTATKKAKGILSRLDAGEPFAELAKKYSDGPYASRGGDWGYISRGHWNAELEAAAFGLEPGTHSGVVKSPLGAHIILLHEKKPASSKPLDEVYSDIEQKLFRQKVSTRRDEWLKKLKRKAYISIIK